MALNFRNPLVRNALPENLAGRFIEGVDLPCVRWIVFDWFDVAIKTEACFVLAARNGADHKYLVAPDDWTRVRETGDRNLPTDVFRLRGVEFYGLRQSFIDARRTWPTKLRPVLRMGYGRNRNQENGGKCESFHGVFAPLRSVREIALLTNSLHYVRIRTLLESHAHDFLAFNIKR